MKIAMIIQNFYPYIGGTENQCYRLSEYLTETLNYKVDIITRLSSSDIKKYEHINDNLNIIRLDCTCTFSFMFKLFIYLIRNINKYDIFHIHLISSHTISALIAAKIFGKKTIVKLGACGEYGDIATSSKSLMGKIKLAITKKLADKFVAPSQSVKQEMLEHGFSSNKIEVIPNMINPSQDNKTYYNAGHFCILYASRLTKQKSPETLLYALNKIKDKDFKCIFLGSGDLKDKLKNYITENNLSDKIDIIDDINDIIPYLFQSDIFVSTSLSEGLSNSILEAGAAGLPVIATDIPGNNDIITENYNGLLFELENIDELSNKIIFFMDNRDKIKEFGLNFKEIIINKYSFEANKDKIVRLYNK